MNKKEVVIKFENVSHGYSERTILNGLDFKIEQGEFLTIVGPSGGGKSTLIKLLLGEEKPNQGKIKFFGKEITKPTKDFGIVYQKYSAFPNLTVLENVAFGLNLIKDDGKQKIKNAKEYLERVGLLEAADKFPFQLSGGMEQRVAIAQALIMEPKILLLDEPFSALDPWTREQLQIFLMELHQKEKTTVIFVTHDLEEAVYLSTRVLVLSPHNLGKDVIGSKITYDVKIKEPYPRLPEFKTSASLNKILADIRKFAFA